MMQSRQSGRGEDPDDNKIIKCALDADCYYIVSISYTLKCLFMLGGVSINSPYKCQKQGT
ncbi:hypothetical protein SAMN02910398_03979 [Butyrivibrio sp. YAB3001]|nr:hypothetical protein SAMN02910398_03979 [Butyrivibrio sp. YAB3001]